MKSFHILLSLFTAILEGTCQSNFQYTSYAPSPLCNASVEFRFPTTIEEVVAIVQEAINGGQTIKAFGGRHSQTDIICTDGIPIDMSLMKSFQLNSDLSGTFGAGVELREATVFLKANGRALRTTPEYGNITIGGGMATGAHGSSLKYPPTLSSQVIAMTIVDGQANIRNIIDEDELRAFRIHLGLLGVVIDVTFATVPMYKFHAINTLYADSVLSNGIAQQWVQDLDTVSLYWFPSVNQVILGNWTMVDVSVPGNAYTYNHVPSTYDNLNVVIVNGYETFANLTQNSCPAVKQLGYSIFSGMERLVEQGFLTFVPDWVPIYTEDGVSTKNPAVGDYDVMTAPICYSDPGSGGPLGLKCPWSHGENSVNILDNEISLPLANLSDIVADVKDILSKGPGSFPLLGILLRFQSPADEYLSNAYGRATIHFEFYIINRKNMYQDAPPFLAVYQTIMQKLVDKYDGKAHWGKCGPVYHTTEKILQKLDPTARQNFINIMNQYDPNELFMNNFGKRLKDSSTVQDLDPKENVHCALRDNCICSKNSDCASYQKCTFLPGYSEYKICQTNGEIPQILQAPPLAPVGSIVQWFKSTLLQLDSIVSSLVGGLACLGQSLGLGK